MVYVRDVLQVTEDMYRDRNMHESKNHNDSSILIPALDMSPIDLNLVQCSSVESEPFRLTERIPRQ